MPHAGFPTFGGANRRVGGALAWLKRLHGFHAWNSHGFPRQVRMVVLLGTFQDVVEG